MSNADLSIPQQLDETIAAEWDRLSSPGTWLRGEERVEIAKEARRACAGEPSQDSLLPEGTVAAVRKIATRAHEIDQGWINRCHEGGLEPLAMVELLSITAKLSAIDTFMLGVGRGLRPLPEPVDGEPSYETVDKAMINHGWLPTRGPAGAPNCFSAVKPEHDALHAFHSSFYISLPEMRDVNLVKDLHRSQLELLAARTSYLNDCFY
jgi:hypothetical protein